MARHSEHDGGPELDGGGGGFDPPGRTKFDDIPLRWAASAW